MSAKRREEAINRFSVPVVESDGEVSQQTRGTRTRKSRASIESGADKDNDNLDSAMEVGDFTDDDDFLDDSEDETAWSKKGKGKAKSRVKGKAKATFTSGENPKVMLISLKGKFRSMMPDSFLIFLILAGALGLNLTVANNVYL